MIKQYTQEDRERICQEYLSSEVTQKEFSKGLHLSAKTLNRWINEGKSKKKPLKFIPIGEIKPPLGLAEIILPNAIRIRLPIELEKISSIAQELLTCK